MSKSETERLTREQSAANIKRWRDGGGMEGELRRRAGLPMAAIGHMPFPGHKHMGEAG